MHETRFKKLSDLRNFFIERIKELEHNLSGFGFEPKYHAVMTETLELNRAILESLQ